MSCCPATETVKSGMETPDSSGLTQWINQLGDNRQSIDLLVPGIHCGGCIKNIESAYAKTPGVTKARVNLSTRRLSLEWQPQVISAADVLAVVSKLGYEARPFDNSQTGEKESAKTGSDLLRALAVAGFASANVMLLSVSVWAGAEGVTRELFHWLSALIALPAVIYAGRPFYRSALQALSHRRLNMDVPISLAVILASAMSLHETIVQGHDTYFDAALTLLFFLLAGRYLDHMMREKARSAVSQLLSLNSTGTTIIDENGEHQFIPVADLKPGMTIFISPGERLPVDGRIVVGTSDVDRSLVTGESLPETMQPGMTLESGVMNLTGPLELKVTAVGKDTFLGEVISLMEAAEQGKARYMQIADRAARIYAPAVHLLALVTFVGWMIWSGGDWHVSVFAAIAVLIITCPCALGLAVPAVQIVASGMLFRRGVLVKAGSALERMSNIDTVVFDKTGTLTSGRLQLQNETMADSEFAPLAFSLASTSRHPLSRALQDTLLAKFPLLKQDHPIVEKLKEVPGMGVQGVWQGKVIKLGEVSWCGGKPEDFEENVNSIVGLGVDGRLVASYAFADSLRKGAASMVADLMKADKKVIILSGDRDLAVRKVAEQLGVQEYHARMKPTDKVALIEALQAQGHKVLMVGDGMNDAPSLAAATASMAPSTASDIGRTAADMVFTRSDLGAVGDALDVSARSTRHVKQNFGLAIAYNIIAVPLAIVGLASPLFAAIAMSTSSIVVISNALRLRLTARKKPLGHKTAEGKAAISSFHATGATMQ